MCAIEFGGLGSGNCCMQQKRCVSSMQHVALYQQRGGLEIQVVKVAQKTSCLRRPVELTECH